MVWLFLLSACDDESAAESAAPRFYVESVDPVDGAVEADVAAVQLRLNGIPDLSRCTTTTMRVDAARDDGTLAFSVPVELSVSGEGFVKLRRIDPYLHGWAYQVTVRGGEGGCADADGLPIEPFFSQFQVP